MTVYSNDPATCAAAATAVRKATNLDFPFDPDAAADVRAAAIRELRVKVLRGSG